MRHLNSLSKLNRNIYCNCSINKVLARIGSNIEQLPCDPLNTANECIVQNLAKYALFKALTKK